MFTTSQEAVLAFHAALLSADPGLMIRARAGTEDIARAYSGAHERPVILH
jgi:hypothetical protein